MRRLLYLLIILAVLGGIGYYAYDHFLTSVVAKSITSDTDHEWMPFEVNEKINKVKKPVNDMAEAVVKRAHDANISIDDIIQAIDDAEEKQAYAFLEELNRTEITDQDQIFTMGKKYFPAKFDVEVFRAPFNEKISVKQIKRGIELANQYKDQEEIDAETAKSIMKKILLQKEEEFNAIVRNN